MNAAANLVLYIRSQKSNLNISQQKIADYIIEDPNRVIDQTSKEISEILSLSEASIVRFCQKLGFKGYRDFRLKMAHDQGQESAQPVPQDITREDSTLEVVRKVLQSESEDILFTSNMIDEPLMLKVLDLISKCNKLAFFGIGSSAIVASTAKEHFLHYGKMAFAETDHLLQLALANSLEPGDVAFAFSISGTSKLPIRALEIAKQHGAYTICMTQNVASPLAKVAEYIIQIYRKDLSIDDLGTMTRIVHLALVDALAIAYASKEWDKTADITRINRENFKEHL